MLKYIGSQRPGVPMSYPVRQITLTRDKPSFIIGRASKNDQKKITARYDNAFYDCAVMSRNHAEIYLDDIHVSRLAPPYIEHINLTHILGQCHDCGHQVSSRYLCQQQSKEDPRPSPSVGR